MHNRKIDGGICAQCKAPIGLVQINGKSIETESQAIVWDDLVIMKLHFCRSIPGDDLADVRGKPPIVNGRKEKARGKP